MIPSECYYFRSSSKRTERRGSILDIKDFGISVIGAVHSLKFRIGLEHRHTSLSSVILNKCSCHSEPRTVLKGTDLSLGIGVKLLGDILDLTCLDVKLPFKFVDSTKGSYPRLISVDRCKIISSGTLKEIQNSLHDLHLHSGLI